jgi:hypothetical protein
MLGIIHIEHTICFLLDEREIFCFRLEIHRDSGRFDCNSTVPLVFPGIGEARLADPGRGDDASLGYKGIGESGLSMVNCGSRSNVQTLICDLILSEGGDGSLP